MAKTIKQIAEEIGVTKSAIHQKRKKEPLKSSLQCFTESVDGTLYIEEQGVQLIIQAFSKGDTVNHREALIDKLQTSVDGLLYTTEKGENNGKSMDDTVNNREAFTDKREVLTDKLPTSVDSLLYTLQGELEAKNKQIEVLQKSVNDLTQALEHAHDSLSKSQALHAGTIQSHLEEKADSTKKTAESASVDETQSHDATQSSPQPSKGFWGRLFKG